MAKVRVQMKQSEFKPLPEGKYEGFLSDPEIIPPKEEGKFPYVQVFFRTEDPEVGEKKVKVMFSFSPKAVWKLVQTLERLGIEHEIEQEKDDDGCVVGETVVFDPEDLAGKSVIAQVVIEKRTWNGQERTQNTVKEIYAPV